MRHCRYDYSLSALNLPGAGQGRLLVHAGSEAHFFKLCSCEFKGVNAKDVVKIPSVSNEER